MMNSKKLRPPTKLANSELFACLAKFQPNRASCGQSNRTSCGQSLGTSCGQWLELPFEIPYHKITLNEILRNKKQEIEKRKTKESIGSLKKKIASAPPVRDFKNEISGKTLTAIAEIKEKSPSAGLIARLDVASIAREYEASKYCSAISVLTDKKYFGGDIKYLKEVKSVTTKPILRKDFIIDEYQIYESRVYGADIILLIASILSQKELKHLFGLAKHLGLACLIELHSVKDLNKIPEEAELYGINNRDLARDFSIDLDVSRKLVRHIPAGKIIIAESGIGSKKDMDFIRSLKRVNAVLIGTSILKTPHPGRALDRLFNKVLR